MSAPPTLEQHIAVSGLTHGRRQDVSYRAGLVVQVLGAGATAVLYPLESPFYTAGIMLFEAGVLLSALSLLIRRGWMKGFILGSVLAGLGLQVSGSLIAPEQYAGLIMIAGVGMVCAGAGGMVGKEAYCFGYREGWVLMTAGFPVMVLMNLLGRENRILNSLGFSALFLLLLSLTGKKLKQPLLSSCPTDAGGLPASQQ